MYKMQATKLNASSILLILALYISFTEAASLIGCYSSLPSSYSDSSTYAYQSSSYCANTCKDYSYFALTQGNTCICGSDAPDSSDSSSSCSTVCFGYGQETCGGSDSYDVYSNGDSVSAASSSSSDTTDTTTSSSSSTVDDTTSPTSTTTSSNTAQTTTTKSTSTSTSTTPTTSKTSDSSITSAVSTQEVSGSTVIIYSTVAYQPTTTETVSETSSSTSTSSSSTSTSSSSSSSNNSKSVVGPAVGGAIGGVVGVSLIVLLIIFLKRRQNKTQRDAELADSAYFSALKRDGSVITSDGVRGHNRQISNPFASKEDTMVDQRLNPVMLGRRRISEGSLADEADYSRKILRVANPDDD